MSVLNFLSYSLNTSLFTDDEGSSEESEDDVSEYDTRYTACVALQILLAIVVIIPFCNRLLLLALVLLFCNNWNWNIQDVRWKLKLDFENLSFDLCNHCSFQELCDSTIGELNEDRIILDESDSESDNTM